MMLTATAERTGGYCRPCERKLPESHRKINPKQLPSTLGLSAAAAAKFEAAESIGRELLPHSEQLIQLLSLARTNPDDFVVRHRSYLGRRDVELPEAIVVQELESEHLLWRFDHRAGAEEVAAALSTLSGAADEQSHEVWLQQESARWQELDTYEALELLGTWYQARQQLLTLIRPEGDSFDVLLLSAEQLDALSEPWTVLDRPLQILEI